MTTGTLVALASLVGRVYAPLTGLTNARVDVMTSMVSFERVFEVLDAPSRSPTSRARSSSIEPRGRIELRDVTFRYPPASEISIRSLESADAPIGDPDRDVLRGVDLVVEAGETVAIVGPSGVGKSTLASLIPRLYDVTEGAVLIDGHDVRDLTGDSLRAAIGVVSQDPHLFHESIESNLRYAKPDATAEELIVACRAARIHDTIAALPDGYATLVGERGYRMSGGEKQRIAIARLLLKDPAMMILDEATSALDNESEVARAGGAGRGAHRPDRARDRPSPLHDPRGRPDRRDRERPDRRAGNPCRTARRRRRLRPPGARRRRRVLGAGVTVPGNLRRAPRA